MEAGGNKMEGKQALDGKQGAEDGEKGKKKKGRKEKKEKKKEKLEKGSDTGQECGAAGLELGGPIAGGDLVAGTNEETRGQSRKRKPKKKSQTQSCSQVSKAWEFMDAEDGVQPEASTSSKPTAMSSQPSTDACDHCIMHAKDCTRRLKMGIPMGACMPYYQAKLSCNLSQKRKRPQQELKALPKTPLAPSLGLGPLPSKKAKASISKLRLKMPSVAQKAKFGIDVGVTPSESIRVYHPLAVSLPQSIPQASALNLITTPVNPLLDP
ncbi:hypothetical protein PAXRUDRAFT_15963 [Paxillus rubicundulus Ve08.2h10]|uniref:Uncharacterized protein n=1 Tax=Paxillus rubicundulus Ve08.2h10 TaxID=930991 RepID=A0A0D0DNE0_9AGAM|nr:hypothetical protein PAXRUDRAFT_15963 [Paxillus rubicundulus Ve08.2h10]